MPRSPTEEEFLKQKETLLYYLELEDSEAWLSETTIETVQKMVLNRVQPHPENNWKIVVVSTKHIIQSLEKSSYPGDRDWDRALNTFISAVKGAFMGTEEELWQLLKANMEHLYLTYHAGGNHWVLLAARHLMNRREIYFLDSLQTYNSCTAVGRLQAFLFWFETGKLLRKYEVNAGHGVKYHFVNQSNTASRLPPFLPPQAKGDGSSCGVLQVCSFCKKHSLLNCDGCEFAGKVSGDAGGS